MHTYLTFFLVAFIAMTAAGRCEAGEQAIPYEGALCVPFVADDQVMQTDNVEVAYGAYGYWDTENGKVTVADRARPGVLTSRPFNVCNPNVDWTRLAWDGQGDVAFRVRATVDDGRRMGMPDGAAWTDWVTLSGSMSIPGAFDGKPYIQFKMTLSGDAEVREIRVYRRIMVPPHPRMLADRGQLEAVRKAIASDPFRKGLFEQFRTYVDTHVVGQESQRERGVWHIGWVGSALGMLYQLTGDRVYAEEAKIQLLRLSGPVVVGGDTVQALDYSQKREFDYSEVAREMPLVYDLVADALTPEERQQIGRELERVADFVESRTRRYRFSDLCNQVYVKNVTAMMAGIGLYGDGVCDEKAARWMAYADRNIYERLVPASNFWASDDGGWGEGPGYAGFTASRFVQELQAWRTATGENVFEVSNFFRYLTQWLVWITRPHNGRTVKFNDSSGGKPGLPWPSLVAGLYHEARAQHFADRYLQEAREAPDGWANMSLWRPILYCDENLMAAPLRYPEMPTARHFEGVGQVVFRSGWDENATFAVLKCQAFRSSGHRHADENTFTIDKMGSLAIESGVDQRRPPDHVRNYFTRTVAHNTVTVSDPDEDSGRRANDGGQYLGEWLTFRSHPSQHGAYNAGSPLWLDGGIVAFETTAHYDYAAGDATGAYSGHKVDRFLRQVVYLKPDLFVMCDRVVSDKAEFAKCWMLHTVERPEVEGRSATVVESGGRLTVTTLLPEDAEVSLVGGPDRAFWVDGKNYPPPQPEKAFEPGGWRMEVRPGGLRRADVFLHVLCASAAGDGDTPQTRLVGDGTHKGVSLTYGGLEATVTFSTIGDAAGHITIRNEDRILMDWDLTRDVQLQCYPPGTSTP